MALPPTSPGPASLVVVGASAGGVEALSALVAEIPGDYPGPVFVVLHIAPSGTSVLPEILTRAGHLPARAARDGEEIVGGRIYVAPPDRHLLVENGVIRLSRDPRENGHRPAVDPTLRSAAASYGRRVVGVVLSGMGDDGSAGLAAVKREGGTALVQDPDEAHYDSMPRSAIATVSVDAILPVRELAARLHSNEALPPHAIVSNPYGIGEFADETGGAVPEPGDNGTRFTCPDCGGVLFEHVSGELIQYRCSVGHAYSELSLDIEQERELEGALWAAVRSLEDRAVLLRRLGERALERRQQRLARSFQDRASDQERRAGVLRGVIEQPGPEL